MVFFHIRATTLALRKLDIQIDTLYSCPDVFLSFAGSSFLRNLIAARYTSSFKDFVRSSFGEFALVILALTDWRLNHGCLKFKSCKCKL